jgi:hypothetical protein
MGSEVNPHAAVRVGRHRKISNLALASARLGHPDEAAEAVRQLVRVAPGFRLGSLRRIRLADEARFQSDLELLRAAQLPE